ncbi:glutaminyl-peptide cyclotransferase [Aurantiacibacter sediminis]|uniref:Glutaminyl-peptide cyclotransferase n=2 Tax=Aurantiacibacter sediminis TaxID=2793064 RepID=A0ABS0N5K7_9SPHN|nr:glutaminyl-peptide cyclotransferase [Aurantiacibacter sediminis]
MKDWLKGTSAPVALFAAVAIGGCTPLAAQTDPVSTSPAGEQEQAAPADPVEWGVEIVAEHPHDATAFTQGLLWHDGYLYESTGRLGTSQVRKLDLETGEVLAASDIPADQFGEGLAIWNDQLISLTWTHGIVHRWNIEDLSLIESVDGFPYEFWGLTTLGDQLVFSDGSSTLRFVNPETFAVEREMDVEFFGEPLVDINELEVMGGLIWANVWFTRYIVGIDPETGRVVQWANLRTITDRIAMSEEGAVLNGIAYDAENDRLFVTGKLWPSLFEIRLVPLMEIGEDIAQQQDGEVALP